MKRVALCIRGAISKKSGAFFTKNEIYKNGEYVNYIMCYNSIVKHIIEPNSDYVFDIFCHCWNVDLEENIISLYNPVKACFEDNTKYNDEISNLCIHNTDFGGISQALTIKKSIELKEEYQKEHNINYDFVIIYRYDVLLWKNILLSNYINLTDNLYVNGHSDSNGDFHFIMNDENSINFKYLYDSIKLNNKHQMHYWIKNYVINYMNKNLIMDDIIPGQHNEVLRKIFECSINPGHLSIDLFNSYNKL
jgi:hypothetical protein